MELFLNKIVDKNKIMGIIKIRESEFINSSLRYATNHNMIGRIALKRH